MARFEIDKGTWIDIVDGKPAMGSLCLREVTIEEEEAIEKITVKTKKKALRGVPYDDSKVNKPLARKLRMEKAIVDWKGIYIDDDVEESPCNDENRVRIMKSVNFLKILIQKLDELFESNPALEDVEDDDEDVEVEGEPKN